MKDSPQNYIAPCMRYLSGNHYNPTIGYTFNQRDTMDCAYIMYMEIQKIINRPLYIPKKTTAPNVKKKKFCIIFRVDEVEYDNPLLQQCSLDSLQSIYKEKEGKSIIDFILNTYPKDDSLVISGEHMQD